jgi:hypothetical protein
VVKRKSKKRSSGKGNAPRLSRGGPSPNYTAGELFMAGIGVLLIVLTLGIVITSIIGD